jgi:tetratricopeptide (TPR) repeat protein
LVADRGAWRPILVKLVSSSQCQGKLLDTVSHRLIYIERHPRPVLDRIQRKVSELEELTTPRSREKSKELALLYGHLGNVHGQIGQHEEALRYQRLALVMNEELYGRDHITVAATLVNLSAALISLGVNEEARQSLVRALEISEPVFGPDHQQVASTLDNLGVVYIQLRQYAEAEVVLRRALGVKDRVYSNDPMHPQIASTLGSLGMALANLRNFAGAQGVLERALAIEEGHYGLQHLQLSNTLTALGDVLRLQGEGKDGQERNLEVLERAIALLQRAIDITEFNHGKDHSSALEALGNLGLALQAAGRNDEAIAIYERTLLIATAANRPKVVSRVTKLIEQLRS